MHLCLNLALKFKHQLILKEFLEQSETDPGVVDWCSSPVKFLFDL